MSAVAHLTNAANNEKNDDVVCTPDFPLEPLCEVKSILTSYFFNNLEYSSVYVYYFNT